MSCPSPFSTIQTLGPEKVKTWNPWCEWPSYFGSANVSLDLSDYLQTSCNWDSTHKTVESCPAWGIYCDDPEYIFASQPLFTVCSMYPNMTRQIGTKQIDRSSSLVSNLTQNITDHGPWETALAQSTSSLVSTCMISWCALIPGCSQSQICANDNIYTVDGYLSTDDLVHCWLQICNSFRLVVNPDFGGFGVGQLQLSTSTNANTQ